MKKMDPKELKKKFSVDVVDATLGDTKEKAVKKAVKKATPADGGEVDKPKVKKKKKKVEGHTLTSVSSKAALGTEGGEQETKVRMERREWQGVAACSQVKKAKQKPVSADGTCSIVLARAPEVNGSNPQWQETPSGRERRNPASPSV